VAIKSRKLVRPMVKLLDLVIYVPDDIQEVTDMKFLETKKAWFHSYTVDK